MKSRTLHGAAPRPVGRSTWRVSGNCLSAMAAFLISALAFLLPAFPARAIFGLGGKTAVLWVPDQGFSDWEGFLSAYRAAGSPGLTVAVAPVSLDEQSQAALKAAAGGKNLEFAMRIAGDPVLPLIAAEAGAPRPQDALVRLALSRSDYERVFSALPRGFVPGGGAVSPGLFSAFKAMGLSWVACGDYAQRPGPWAQTSGVVLAPLHPVSATDLPELLEPGSGAASSAVVVDEADGLVHPGSMMSLLSQAASQKTRLSWESVSQAVQSRRGSAQAAAALSSSWPDWMGGFSAWNSSGPSQAAWSLYAMTAKDLERYQNSGTADLKSLESAGEALYAAQASRFFRLVASSDAAVAAGADDQFRKALREVYARMGETPPDPLYHSLLSQSLQQSSAATAAFAEESPDVHLSQGPDWISFENPAQTRSYTPYSTAPVADSSLPDAAWKILDFRVEWSSQSIAFSYQMADLDSEAGTGNPLGRVMLDTYIDINHVAGAGSTDLLPGRNAYTHVSDAWEYALTLGSKGAFLYRSSIGGPPQQIAEFSIAVDTQTSRISFALPREMLIGNPANWGYIVLSLAPDPFSTAVPPAPAANPGSSPILCLLAPLDAQRSFYRNPTLERLQAVRTPD